MGVESWELRTQHKMGAVKTLAELFHFAGDLVRGADQGGGNTGLMGAVSQSTLAAGELNAEERDAALFAVNVDLNLFSAYRASRAVIDGMVERSYGRIVNIGSGYAKRSGGGAAYTAAKHGLIGLTRAMAAQVATRGVTVNCLCPGWTNTQLVNLDAMARARGTDVATVRTEIESENLQGRILEPEELGPMAALLAAPESAGITG